MPTVRRMSAARSTTHYLFMYMRDSDDMRCPQLRQYTFDSDRDEL